MLDGHKELTYPGKELKYDCAMGLRAEVRNIKTPERSRSAVSMSKKMKEVQLGRPPASLPEDGGPCSERPPASLPEDGGPCSERPPASLPEDGGPCSESPPASLPEDEVQGEYVLQHHLEGEESVAADSDYDYAYLSDDEEDPETDSGQALQETTHVTLPRPPPYLKPLSSRPPPCLSQKVPPPRPPPPSHLQGLPPPSLPDKAPSLTRPPPSLPDKVLAARPPAALPDEKMAARPRPSDASKVPPPRPPPPVPHKDQVRGGPSLRDLQKVLLSLPPPSLPPKALICKGPKPPPKAPRPGMAPEGVGSAQKTILSDDRDPSGCNYEYASKEEPDSKNSDYDYADLCQLESMNARLERLLRRPSELAPPYYPRNGSSSEEEEDNDRVFEDAEDPQSSTYHYADVWAMYDEQVRHVIYVLHWGFLGAGKIYSVT